MVIFLVGIVLQHRQKNKMKEGAIPLRFLVSLILAIVIFLPVILVLSKCSTLTAEGKLKKSLTDLLEAASKLKPDEVDAVLIFIPAGYEVHFGAVGCKGLIWVKRGGKEVFRLEKDGAPFRARIKDKGKVGFLFIKKSGNDRYIALQIRKWPKGSSETLLDCEVVTINKQK